MKNVTARIIKYQMSERAEQEKLWAEMNQIERTAANRLSIMDDYRKGLMVLEETGSGFFSHNALKKAIEAEDEFYNQLIGALERGVTQLIDM